MNSEKLKQYVIDELSFDPKVDATNIDVSVHDRVVTLSGHVRSFADKMALTDAVARVKGVRNIILDVDISHANGASVSDEEIAKRATALLDWSNRLPKGAVKVTVKDGCLTLSGTVDCDYQRSEAEQELKHLAGITDLRNGIVIRLAEKKEAVQESIEEAIHRHANLDNPRIRVDVDEEGNVTLKGKVDDWLARQIVEDTAWLAAGVKTVDNLVKVR